VPLVVAVVQATLVASALTHRLVTLEAHLLLRPVLVAVVQAQ
jgi:hypothetical protein